MALNCEEWGDRWCFQWWLVSRKSAHILLKTTMNGKGSVNCFTKVLGDGFYHFQREIKCCKMVNPKGGEFCEGNTLLFYSKAWLLNTISLQNGIKLYENLQGRKLFIRWNSLYYISLLLGHCVLWKKFLSISCRLYMAYAFAMPINQSSSSWSMYQIFSKKNWSRHWCWLFLQKA